MPCNVIVLIPTMFMNIIGTLAENDTVAPRRFSGVLKSMLGDRVQLGVLKNAGHAMAPEQPDRMADAIAAFARKTFGRR